MSEEALRAIKYNPANFSSDHLFRPPTSCTHGELSYLAHQLCSTLEGGETNKRRLLVGTEFEVLFFSRDVDPVINRSEISIGNPNYSLAHQKKINKIAEFAYGIQFQRPTEYLSLGREGRICLEFRTAPQSVRDHLDTVGRLGDLLREECRNLEVLPVVHSQHIHMSLREKPVLQDPFGIGKETAGIIPVDTVVRSAFSNVTPLMLLPEEWESRYHSPCFIKENGRDRNSAYRLEHPEFRMLSSEYAHDPLLNLIVSLRAMCGCVDDKNIPSKETIYDDDYSGSVHLMEKDPELLSFFGQSTLQTLGRIAAQYPDVSQRHITINQVK